MNNRLQNDETVVVIKEGKKRNLPTLIRPDANPFYLTEEKTK